jgi:hypothetical protein
MQIQVLPSVGYSGGLVRDNSIGGGIVGTNALVSPISSDQVLMLQMQENLENMRLEMQEQALVMQQQESSVLNLQQALSSKGEAYSALQETLSSERAARNAT